MPHPRPLPGFLAMAMLRRGDDIGWVVHRSVQSMMTGEDLVDGKLGALTMPVLIGWGDQDRLIPLSVGYRLHAEILQSELDVYANCGHLAPGQCVGQVAPERGGFSECTAGADGDGSADPGYRQPTIACFRSVIRRRIRERFTLPDIGVRLR